MIIIQEGENADNYIPQKKSIHHRQTVSQSMGRLSSALVDSTQTQMEMCTHVCEHNIQNADLG